MHSADSTSDSSDSQTSRLSDSPSFGLADSPPTPKQLGYHFPAEFAKHDATWLSWPHKEASWPGKIKTIYPIYAEFVKFLAEGEQVNINVMDEAMKQNALHYLREASANLDFVKFFMHPTNDAWCRDHGPAFVINTSADQKKI